MEIFDDPANTQDAQRRGMVVDMLRLEAVKALEDNLRDPWSILSIDGGGIYGLVSANWLRMLCEQDPAFLTRPADLYAGCSSGAVNTLLLAKYQEPRKAVLDGELEDFWKDAGTFSNSNPVTSALSWFGLTGWFWEEDFLKLLRKHFEDRQLKDLPGHVIISTYNWTGASQEERRFEMPYTESATMAQVYDPSCVPRAKMASQRKFPVRSSQVTRFWKPKFFHNYAGNEEDEPDLCASVVDVAYAAATPPGFRALRGGLGDGASFNSNPSLAAIALLLNTMVDKFTRFYFPSWQAGMTAMLEAKSLSDVLDDEAWAEIRELAIDMWAGQCMRNMRVLSLGSGQSLPHYAFANVDFGFRTFNSVPSNPLAGNLFPPSAYALDASSEEADYLVKQLLGPDRALRLNPGLMPIPTVLAAYYARFPRIRKWLIRQIYASVASSESRMAVEAALEFLERSRFMPLRGV